jgi:hypothetical protein
VLPNFRTITRIQAVDSSEVNIPATMEANSIRLTYPVSSMRFVMKFLLPDTGFTLSEDGRHFYNEKIPDAQ